MVVQSVGDKLRQARVRKGLQVSEIEALTGIESHLLLAMELDQFSLLPEDKSDLYLENFAKAVGLNATEMLAQCEVERTNKPQMTYDYTNDSDIEESNLFIGSTRVSRLDRRRPKKSSGFVKMLLSLAILAGLIFLAYRYYPTISAYVSNTFFPKSSPKAVKKDVSDKVEEVTPVVEEVVEEKPKTSIVVEGGGNHLTARITTSESPVRVSFSLDGAESSWVGLTSSDLGELGTLLDANQPSFQTSLFEGTTEAVMSFGISKGVTVMINDVPLDLSLFETDALSSVTLIISPEAVAEPTVQN